MKNINQKKNYYALEFIHLLASEANSVCEKENKKTIGPDHVFKALEVKLFFFPPCFWNQLIDQFLIN